MQDDEQDVGQLLCKMRIKVDVGQLLCKMTNKMWDSCCAR